MSTHQALLEAWCLAKRNWLGVLEAAVMGTLLLIWAAGLGAMVGLCFIYI